MTAFARGASVAMSSALWRLDEFHLDGRRPPGQHPGRQGVGSRGLGRVPEGQREDARQLEAGPERPAARDILRP